MNTDSLAARIVLATAACAVIGASATTPATAQPAGDFVPVTDAMLQAPAPEDWLTWRRTTDSWGFRRLCSITDWKQVTCGVLEVCSPRYIHPIEPGVRGPGSRFLDFLDGGVGGAVEAVGRWSGGAVERWRLDTTKTGLWMSRPRSWILS